MKRKPIKMILTEKDKKTSLRHANVCTDLNGKGCNEIRLTDINKNLN